MIAVVAFIVFVERSERRIPIQSARRIVGRRMMGGQSSHLPLKVNSGGVMPVIFASSILSVRLMLGQVEGCRTTAFSSRILQRCSPVIPWYELADMRWASSSLLTSMSRL
jgi:preprotein translocase subunit SecY